MPKGIDITPRDIDLVAKELNLRLDCDERLAVLNEITSCDVQAGPGSGKTTILTAKLAILARRWPYHDRGICVLSHTNVARREIEQKLSQSNGLRRLLQYPHFIGTIQTFVDQFLAVPYLRRERIEVAAIDNERFGARAWTMLSRDFRNARFAIERYFGKTPEKAQWVVANLRLDGAHMGVTHPMMGAKRFPTASSYTGKALIAVKQALRAEGYFRFDDMFAFAEACLFRVPYIASAVRRRFPWVFVDELQDTSVMQDRVIEQLFATEACIFQRFGDKNQAIFDFESGVDENLQLFGRRKTLFLNSSHRFGASVARLVSPLTIVEPQNLVGNAERTDHEHTVFIFERGAVKKVLPTFGDLVLKTVPKDVLQKLSVCVVASRVNSAEHSKDNFPSFLGEYMDSYISPKAAKPKSPDTFLGYIVEGRSKWKEEGTGAEAHNCAIAGTLALLRRSGLDTLVHSRSALQQGLLREGRLTEFQKTLWRLLNPFVGLDEKTWNECTERLVEILGVSKLVKDVRTFLSWEECKGAEGHDKSKAARVIENTYIHRSDGAELPIRLASIHSVKGETHAATLVVETFARQHDIEALLPVLTGASRAAELKDSAHGHCKRLFVAMSRPSHLLSLAISSENINDAQISALAANGWNIVKIQT